jgi:hypothetical protein
MSRQSVPWRVVGALVLAAAVTVGAMAPVHAAQTPASSAAATATPVVAGNVIRDSQTGSTWIPHGVNWPSFEYACQQGWAESADGATVAAANAMVSWGINAVRIPLNQDCWLGVDGAPAYGTVASYKAALAAWVGILNTAGIVVILDLHWTAPAGSVADGQRAMPDAQSVTFWSQVAAAYANKPSVMFETFNEPYSRGSYQLTWSCWKNGGCTVPSSNDASSIGTKTYTAHGMAEVVAAIRAAGATQPILLDGLNYANDLTGWLANRPTDTQLIASWHNYPGQGCSDASCWNAQVLPVAATVPVIATEFGMTDSDPSFVTGFMNWADAHGIGYAPWAWWVTDSSDGPAANLYSLISNLTNFAPRAPEGTVYHDHLASLGPPPSYPAEPAPPAGTAIALASPSFESGLASWHAGNGALTLTVSGPDLQARGGAYSLTATPAAAARSVAQTISRTVPVGETDTAAIWVKTTSGATATGQLALWGLGGTGNDLAITAFTATGTWTQITATLTSTHSGHTTLQIETYLNSPGIEYRLDSAALVQSATPSYPAEPAPPAGTAIALASPSFENGLASWHPGNGALTLTVTGPDLQARGGAYSLVATPAAAARSVAQSITRAVPVGETDTAALWVKTTSGATATGQLALWGLGGTGNDVAVTAFAATGTWTQVTATLTSTHSGHTTLQIETYLNTPGIEYRLDSASLTQTATPSYPAEPAPPAGTAIALTSPSFENGLASWHPGNGALTLTVTGPDLQARGGAYSLTATPAAAARSVAQAVSRSVPVGETDTAAIWVKTTSGATATGQLALWALGGTGNDLAITAFTATGTWTQITASLTSTHSGHTSLQLETYLNSPGIEYRLDSAALVQSG